MSVSSGTGLPGLSRTKAVKWLCVCVCVSLIVRQLCTGNSILFKLQVDVSDLSSAGLLAYQWQWLGLMNDSVSVC